MLAILSRSQFRLLPSLVIQVAIYLAFYGVQRPREFTYIGPGCQALRRCHLTHLKDHFVLNLSKPNSVALGSMSSSFRPTTSGAQDRFSLPALQILASSSDTSTPDFLDTPFGLHRLQLHLSTGCQTMPSRGWAGGTFRILR